MLCKTTPHTLEGERKNKKKEKKKKYRRLKYEQSQFQVIRLHALPTLQTETQQEAGDRNKKRKKTFAQNYKQRQSES